jgi:hypothetical protein
MIDFREQIAEFEAFPKMPLQIELRLLNPLLSYHSLHLDSILTSVVAQKMGWIGEQVRQYMEVPAPLEVTWRSQAGVPLYACTDLVPVDGDPQRGEMYYHMRALQPSMTHANLNTQSGRHKEKRTAIPSLNNRHYRAFAIGHLETIISLLNTVTAVGKKRHSAGTVESWFVEPCSSFCFVSPDRKALRPLPIAFVHANELPLDIEPMPQGFSPPYWHLACNLPCYATGMYLSNEGVRGTYCTC